MDFYYRKSMGNGTVASKFRLNSLQSPAIQSKQSSLRDSLKRGGEEIEAKPEEPITEPEVVAPITPSSSNSKSPEESLASLPVIITETGKQKYPVENPDTHHRNNCNRCYRLKKKCSREYPKCKNCGKTGAECEYVVRSNKRRKRNSGPRFNGEGVLDTTAAKEDVTQEFQLVNGEEKKSNSDKSEDDKIVVAHKLVSVSSLLANELSEESPKVNFSGSRRGLKKITTAELSSSARRAKEAPEIPLSTKIVTKSLISKSVSFSNLKEEFINMKSISDEKLPTIFALNYFENYSSKYPFIDRTSFLSKLNSIDFKNESIVNLDVYLLLSIGSLTHDQTPHKDVFRSYFNEKNIDSIVDVLNLGLTNATDEEVIDNLKLLLLLTIYSVASLNEDLCWGLLGVLNRLVIKLELYKPSENSTLADQIQKERIFWSVHNLDKDISLLLKRPSQFPSYDFIKLDLPLDKSLHGEENLDLINQEIKYHQFQDTLLSSSLSGTNRDSEKLREISSSLDKWRIVTSSIIHKTYSHSPLLQDWTSLINMNYYYLLIELDQISPSESFQFPLHFLSNSFSLIISESESESSRPDIKVTLKTSLTWYKRLFQVIDYSMDSLVKLVDSKSLKKLDLSLRLSEFNSNLQLFVNLLRYISDSEGSESQESDSPFSIKVNRAAVHLNELHAKLAGFNVMTSKDEDRLELKKVVEKIDEGLKSVI